MKLRQLFENIYAEVQDGEVHDGALKTIGVCFGRFNPPHKGHKAVWQAAATNPIWYVGTNQSTSGPKDPLPYDVKLQAMAAVWPKVAGHVIPEQSLLTLASRIYEEHGANVHLKVYTDEQWLIKTLQQYNGVEKEHGMYNFAQIDWAKTERLASATNLRAAVRAGDRDAFYKDMGIKPSVTIEVNGKEYPMFDVVAHFLNKYPEKTKKVAVAESNKHSIIGKFKRGEELYGKVKSSFKDISDAQKKGDKEAASKAFKKHERYANLRAPGTFTKVDEHNFLESYFEDRALAISEGTTNAQGNKATGITKKPDPTQKAAMKNAMTMPDLNQSTGSAYLNWRMGIALAGAPDFPTKAEADNWIGGDPLLSTYTEEEMEMVKAAALAVGAGKIENWSGKRSEELPTVNKTSTTAKIKKNKYGV